MPSKGPNDVWESIDQEKEKDVIRIKSIREIPDGYDVAGTDVQYIMDRPQ